MRTFLLIFAFGQIQINQAFGASSQCPTNLNGSYISKYDKTRLDVTTTETENGVLYSFKGDRTTYLADNQCHPFLPHYSYRASCRSNSLKVMFYDDDCRSWSNTFRVTPFNERGEFHEIWTHDTTADFSTYLKQ